MGTGERSDMDDLIVISTETIEQKAGNLLDSCTSLTNAEKPVKAAGQSLSAVNSTSTGCISEQLKKLFDAEASFYKNVAKLENGAYALRNIGITYDNAEQTIAGGETRDLIWPDKGSSGSGGSTPGSGGSGSGDNSSTEKKSSSPQWKWNKREDLQSFEDAAWYDVLFDYSHKIQIGKKKKINSPEYGGYTNQETFSWNVGFNLGQYGDKKNPLEYKNPETGKKESYGEYKTNTKGDPKFAPNKVGTIAEIYAEYACSWTLVGAQTVKRGEYYSYAAEAYVMRAQFKAHAGVGAFLYQTPDGKLVTAYGLSANVGASFTLAGASASGDYGSNYLGAMGGASVVVGEVYAKANCTVGMVGGKFVAVASGAVGADAFRATISGGIRFLGLEVQGSATFKVGLSAKFEVGFDGGKFKANIGAALGIGVELSFSIDFSKCISVLKDIGVFVADLARGTVEVVERGVDIAVRAVRRFFRRW